MLVIQFVNSIFESNTYLIEMLGCYDCFLIDCGDVQSVVRYMRHRGLLPKVVFITHTHYDHIYGLNKLCEIYPNLLICTSSYGKEGLYSDKLNLSKYHKEPFILQSDNVEVLKTGQELLIFDSLVLKVYETPGHDWSSLCYKVEDVVFTGDSYLPQYSLIANFPKSNKQEAIKSLDEIKNFSAGCSIYPGHGDIMYA